MIKPSKHKISNGYTKLKSIRQFEGYKVTSYGASFIKNPSYVEQTPTRQRQDSSYRRLKNRAEEMYPEEKIFKLYLTISDAITQSVGDYSLLKKIREIECQLLKLILLNPTAPPPTRQEKLSRRLVMTQNISKQNSIPSTPNPIRDGFMTSDTKKRRVYQKSMMESTLLSFENFRINESIKRLETELDKMPQVKLQLEEKELSKEPDANLQNQIKNFKIKQKHMEGQLDLKNLRVNSLIEEIHKFQAVISQLQSEIVTLTQQNKSIMIELTSYRNGLHYQQLWRMASEEVESIRINKIELERQLKHLNKKYKQNKDRLNQLIKHRSSGVVDEAKQDMQDVKFLIAQLNQTHKTSSKDENEGTSKPQLKLPNVLVLFDSQKLKQSELNNNKNRVLGFEFFLKLRGIMDSKYNQFWSNTEARNCMNLADFAMGFLDKFTIDQKYKKITVNGSNPQQTEKNKLEFILNLSSNKVKDVIQISLFKQFLFDERQRDQLFFYLSCRHVLFNGHVLDNFISSQDPIIFIPLDRAYKVIDQILINFDKNLTDRIKQSLNLKRKKKAHKFFIDGHFLLKALLELYSLQRRKKLGIFRKSLISDDPQKEVSFKIFKKFLNKNYSFVTNAEITEIYRVCWKLTNGKVQISTLFNLCDWIFVQELKDQIFLPKRFNNEFKQYMERVEVHLEEGKYFTRKIFQLGTEKLLIQSNKLKQAMAMKNRDCLNIEHLFGLMNILELPKTIKVMEILATAASNKLVKIPYFGENDFRLVEFGDITEINAKNEEHRRKLKEAAEKIGIYFDSRIKTLYKRFGADINKELMEISIGMK